MAHNHGPELTECRFPDYKYDYIGVTPEAVGFIDADAEICYYFVTWLNQALYTPILGLIKASSLVFVLRIAGHMRNVRRTIHVSEKRIDALSL